jgi:CDP-diacylglycerol--serine O-phosphatidyltransferase
MLEQETAPWWRNYFTGVPAPGGCWMVLTPVLLSVALDAKGKFPEFQDAMQSPFFGSAMLVFVGALMASRLPTISLKAVRFTSRRQMRIFTAIALLLIALLVSNIWLTLGIIGLLYIMTVPVTCWLFLRGKRRYLASHPPSAREAADA